MFHRLKQWFTNYSNLSSSHAEPTFLSQKIQTVIAIQESPESIATLQVLSLFGFTPKMISQDYLTESLNLPDESVLILVENQIRIVLPKLRRQGYKGAVIILSQQPFETIKTKYPILCYGVSSHKIIPLFFPLSKLRNELKSTIPIGEDNFKDLQDTLDAPIEYVNKKIIPLLDDIENDNLDLKDNLEHIEQEIRNILSWTPDFEHEVRKRFEDIIKALCESPEAKRENIEKLRQMCQQWQNHVINTAEGIDHLP